MFIAHLGEGKTGFCGTKAEIKQFAENIIEAICHPEPSVKITDNAFGDTIIYLSVQPEKRGVLKKIEAEAIAKREFGENARCTEVIGGLGYTGDECYISIEYSRNSSNVIGSGDTWEDALERARENFKEG